MQIGQAQVVRSEWYDRSPLIVNASHSISFLNDVETSRWSYTVPANRKCKIGHLGISINHDSATTTGNETFIGRIAVTPNGGATTNILFNALTIANVGAGNNVKADDCGILSAGDVIEYFTDITNDGTAFAYMIGAFIGTEYDA